jgi:hypothetical protein
MRFGRPVLRAQQCVDSEAGRLRSKVAWTWVSHSKDRPRTSWKLR